MAAAPATQEPPAPWRRLPVYGVGGLFQVGYAALHPGVARDDPIRDLRPVCPNCHVVIHRREPPYSIDEVRQLLTQQRLAEPPS